MKVQNSKQKLTFTEKLVQHLGITPKRVFNQTITEMNELHKAQLQQAIETQRRSPVKDTYGEINKIVDVPYNYSLLIYYSWTNEVLRQVHDAIIREVTRNGWTVTPKWACKCTLCGAEYQNHRDKCPECKGATRKPDPEQKEILKAFIEDPNPDNELTDIVKSSIRYMLSVDDWWLSIQYANLQADNPLTIYVEDSRNMRVVSDDKGRLGNGEYFCPTCTGEHPEKTYQKGQKCKKHPETELKETAYVYLSGQDVKARFAKDEILHSIQDPLLPSLYGNSKTISCLKIILSIFAMDQFNLTTYSQGKLAQILCFEGMTPEQATELAKETQKQKDIAEYDARTGEKVASLLTLFLGAPGPVTKVNAMPPSDQMQNIEWWKLWREIVCSIYGVTPVFSGVVEAGKSGNNPRMQIDVQNNTTEMVQKSFQDPFNTIIVPKLGVTDWKFTFNPVEEKDEMQDITILNSKLDALQKAVNLGLTAELTDEGEVKVSGKPLTLEEKTALNAPFQAENKPSVEAKPSYEQKNPFKRTEIFSTEKAVGGE